jgi:acetolactate synthase-1/2/3 large subunit
MERAMEKNGGEVLVDALRSRGVDTAFFVAGGTFVTVLEAMSRRRNEIRAVGTRLESSAVFAAEAYVALSRKPACVFVSRAPGAANAAIGIHTAKQASRPLVLFVADIPLSMRQREAFQEVDYRLMYAPIAKAVLDVAAFEDIPRVVTRAIDLSMAGRPGPVVVSVSRDLLDGETGNPAIPLPSGALSSSMSEAAGRELAALLQDSERPLFIAGEMIDFEGAHAALVRAAEATGAGVLAAYRQQSIFPNSHPNWLGQLTLNRTDHIEKALDESDLVVAIGTRLDSVTTNDYTIQRSGQRWVLIHPEASVHADWVTTLSVVGDASSALATLVEHYDPVDHGARDTWRAELNRRERLFAVPDDVETVGAVNMARVIADFRANVPDDAIIVSDAGTFGRWIQRYYCYDHPDTSLGPISGAMGYGVPGGIGAAIARPDRRVFVWVGDGGFQMTGNEAAVMVQEQLPVTIIVCDNSAWGSILVYEQKRFPGLDFGTMLHSPDFAKLGEGYGMASFTVNRSEEFAGALEGAMSSEGPSLIHLKLDARDVSPFPIAAPEDGKPISD